MVTIISVQPRPPVTLVQEAWEGWHEVVVVVVVVVLVVEVIVVVLLWGVAQLRRRL